jgi:energy-coupling factor transporter ATP-binding protein EcfA2
MKTPALRRTRLSSVQPRHQVWTWEGRIPHGEMTLLAGPEGVGKSTFLAWFTAGMTRGTLPGHLYGQPRAVLIAALEDDVATTLRPRMEAAGADLELVDVIEAPDGTGLRLPDHLGLIDDALRARDFPVPIGALILDPVKSTAPGINPEREGDVRPLLAKVLTFAQSNGITVIPSAHFKKGSADEDFAAWKVSGSPAWTQLPRSVLFFAEDPEADDDDPDARLVAHAKCNVGRRMPTMQARVVSHLLDVGGRPLETSRLVMGGESTVRAGDFGKADREQRTAQADAADFLRSYLSDGIERESADIIEAGKHDGHSAGTLRRATDRAGVIKRRSGSGSDHCSVWSIPAGIGEQSGLSDLSEAPSALTLLTPISPPTGGDGLDDLGPEIPQETFNDALKAVGCRCGRPLPAPDDDGDLRCAGCGHTCASWGVAA